MKILLLSVFFAVTLYGLTFVNAETALKDDFKGVSMAFPSGVIKQYPDPKKWAFTFLPGSNWPDSYGDGTNWLNGNDECQTYVTPLLTQIKGVFIPRVLRYDPFFIKKDGLHIRAQLLSEEQRQAYQTEASYRRFGSGMLRSPESFLYGKIRLVAKLPKARGSWPAFWMLPASFEWPPEIDIFEGMAWGKHTKEFHAGIIPKKTEGKPEGAWYNVGADLSEDFHEYGLDWTPETINGLFDGKGIWSKKTPASMKQRMYLIINLAVGGKWPFNELGVKPINGREPQRLLRGTTEIQCDYPDDLVIKSVTVNVYGKE
jgi:hypothetical protein